MITNVLLIVLEPSDQIPKICCSLESHLRELYISPQRYDPGGI